MGWLTAFVDVAIITIVKDGGFYRHPQFDMRNVGIKDFGLPLLLALYGFVGFLLLTYLLSKYWELDSTQCYRNQILLHIFLLLGLYCIFLSEKLRRGGKRRKEGAPPTNSKVGGFETAILGIAILAVFCGATAAYWYGTKTTQPVVYGAPPAFAALLIFIAWAHTDWKRKNEFGVLPEGEKEYQSKLEFLKILHSKYSWNTRICVYLFLGVAVAFSWGAAQIAVEHRECFRPVAWGMMFAGYASVGVLLIAMQFFAQTLHRIEREILELKRHNNSSN